MYRLVPDTNVWISAFITPGGLCDKLVPARGHDDLRFLTSRYLLKEIEEVLHRKFEMPGPVVEARLKYVIQHTQLVESKLVLSVIPACEADNRVLECAVAGRAHYLVTGDKGHLIPLGHYEGVEMVTPRKMVDLLRL